MIFHVMMKVFSESVKIGMNTQLQMKILSVRYSYYIQASFDFYSKGLN